MSKQWVAAAVLVMLPCWGPQPVAAEEAPKRRTIDVSGRGEVSVAPDLAILAFAVETANPEAGTAVSQNAAKSAKVSAALKSRLGPKDSMSTTRYSLEPRYQYPERGSDAPPTITGYVARNDVRLEIHALDGVGALIDAATAAGANRVSELQFTLEERGPALRSALAKAGSEARAQAESVAAALGVQLKQVVAATAAPPPIEPRFYEGAAMRASAEAKAPTQVEPGAVSVSATLNVTYEIE
jgi:uncharacterized protein YggE